MATNGNWLAKLLPSFFYPSETQDFQMNLMDYDEYGRKKFHSLLIDYYALNIDTASIEEIREQSSPNSKKEGEQPDTKPIKDDLLEGCVKVARRIYKEYVRGSSSSSITDLDPLPETIRTPPIEDIIRFEQCIIRFLPPVEMSYRGIRIQHKFSEAIANSGVYDKIVAKFQSDELKTPEQVLARRLEVDFMLQVISDSYMSAAYRNRFTYRITMYNISNLIFLYVVFALCIVAVSSIRGYDPATASLNYLIVPFMGSLGACISLMQQTQTLPIQGDVLRKSLELNSGVLGSLTSLLIGAIFAILVNLLFTADYVKSEFFPKFMTTTRGTGGVSALSFIFDIHSFSAQEVAKIMIWSVVAGFAQRIIPNNLSRLADTLNAQEFKDSSSVVGGNPYNIERKTP